MTRIKNGAVIPTKAPQLVEQALLTDPENRTIEIASVAGTKGKMFVSLMGGEGNAEVVRETVMTLAEAIDNIADVAVTASTLKVNYTTGDLDAEAEVIAALNATNAAINTATGKLKDVADALAELTAALIANGFMAAGA